MVTVLALDGLTKKHFSHYSLLKFFPSDHQVIFSNHFHQQRESTKRNYQRIPMVMQVHCGRNTDECNTVDFLTFALHFGFTSPSGFILILMDWRVLLKGNMKLEHAWLKSCNLTNYCDLNSVDHPSESHALKITDQNHNDGLLSFGHLEMI